MIEFNSIVLNYDLPEFYDPIEADKYTDRLDSYNFNSIFAFMTNPVMRSKHRIHFAGNELLYKIHIVWLARILSQKLLAEVIFTVLQIEFKEHPII